jgi:hypothetical protein
MTTDEADVTRTERAIQALLEQPNLMAASKQAGIPYTSFRRLLSDPAFQAELRVAKTAVMDGALVYLRGLAQKAAEVVEQTLDGRNANGLRFRAACWTLDKGIEGLVSDLVARIEKLEADRGTST